MKRAIQVKNFLSELESAAEASIPWVAHAVACGAVGDVEVAIHPISGDARVRRFNVSEGLTTPLKHEIRDWFLPVAMENFASTSPVKRPRKRSKGAETKP